MRSGNQHLSAEEIELLGKEEGLSGELGEQLRPAREHANACPACRRRLEVYPTTGAKLEKLRAPRGAQKGPDCPSIDVWPKLAAGVLTAPEQQRYTVHAAQCGYCGPVLREVVQDFSAPITEEENAALEALSGQKKISQRLIPSSGHLPEERSVASPKPDVSPPRNRWLLKWQLSAAAFVLCAAIAVVLFRFVVPGKDTSAIAERLLAQAYSEQRTLELRMPGAMYGQMRVERGGGISHERQPASLFEAEVLIARNIAKHGETPDWLQARGRAALLEWNYEDALKDIDGALIGRPDDPSLLVDKASALFQRAEVLDHQDDKDYGAALDCLGAALSKKPEDPIALFNSAIVAERLTAYETAIEDWKRYLNVDSSSPWAAEAQRHLQDLQRQRDEHYKHESQAPSDPARFLELSIVAVNERIEDYVNVALMDWLPQAFPISATGESTPSSYPALLRLAEILERGHGDRWLYDVLQTSPSRSFSLGISSLAEAVRKNSLGDIGGALRAAENASRFLRSGGSVAGAARADLEKVYALHRLGDGKACLSAANRLQTLLGFKPYLWIRSSLFLERVVAFNLVGSFVEAHHEQARAFDLARSAHYTNLRLRSVAFQASIRGQEGDIVEAWGLDLAGLRAFWTTIASPVLAYNFYADLASLAENMGYLYLAYVFRVEALRVSANTKDVARNSIAHFLLGKAALMVNLRDRAEAEFSTTIKLLQSLPHASSSEIYELYSDLELAKAESNRKSPAELSGFLKGLEPRFLAINHRPLWLAFYKTLGELQLDANRVEDAVSTYASAIAIANNGFRSLRTQRERLAWKNQTEPIFKGMVRLLLYQGKTAEALATWEAYRASTLAGRWDATNSSATLSHSIGQFLKDKTLISYVVLPDYVAVWTYDDRGINFVKLAPISSDLDRVIRQLKHQCTDRISDLGDLQTNARKLYDWLIRPIEIHLDATKILLVETDGSLEQVPFQVLVGSDGRYLAEHYAIAVSPGIEYRSHLRNAILSEENSRVVILQASAIFSAQHSPLPSLPDSEREASSVAAHFRNAVILKGSETAMGRLAASLYAADVFHFVGHAAAGPDNVSLLISSGTGGAGTVDAIHLRITPMKRLQLAVLAGCSTAAATSERLPDLDNLVNVFFETGVHNVIASRWDVDSSVVSTMMNSFYTNILAGLPASRALQAAAMETMKISGSHPYFWAALSDYGLN